jgi:hypothetical protein
VDKILSSDAAVFNSALAVRHFAEVGGPQAVKELAGEEKEYVPSPEIPFPTPPPVDLSQTGLHRG